MPACLLLGSILSNSPFYADQQSTVIGSTLSHYRIVEELGRGGMGIVYKAEDTRLDRIVALKVLPASALSNEDDRARFYREAKAAAQLTHTHIAAIYEIDEAVPEGGDVSEPRPFIAMEYVDGQSLSGRIAEGPLKLDESLRIASQIARALEAAHDKHIVHRDIKSANIMLTAKGDAKVLDFGLAKTAQSTRLTQLGSTLGTVAYMSPEQARGEDVDQRADLWALGVVLYEMISGQHPFRGDYEQAIVYSILNNDPEPLTAIRTGVPMGVESTVEKLLRKDPALRYQSAADLVADLTSHSIKRESTAASADPKTAIPSAGPAQTPERRLRPALWAIIGLIAGAAAVWLIGVRPSPPLRSPEPVRSTIVLPDDHPLMVMGPNTLGVEIDAVDLTDDGSMLAYVTPLDGTPVIAVRDMRTGSVLVLEETVGATNPHFSPDGRQIAYLTPSAIYLTTTVGGRPRFLSSASEATGLDWFSDNYIYWGEQQGRWIARMKPDGEPEQLPSAVSCGCGLPTEGPPSLGLVVSLRDREVVEHYAKDGSYQTLPIRGNHVSFLPSGHVIYARTGALYAQRFDRRAGLVDTDERAVLNDLRTGSILRSGHYAVSGGGTFVYVAGEPSGLVSLVIRDSDGFETDIGLPVGVYGPVFVSPDEHHIVAKSYDQGSLDLVLDLETGVHRPLPLSGEATSVIWGHESRQLLVSKREGGIVSVGITGGQESELLASDAPVIISDISDDGRLLAYRRAVSDDLELVVRDIETGTDTPVSDGSSDTFWALDFSPDGKFVTYTRVGERGSEVFVSPWPPDGKSWRISTGPGEESLWLPDRSSIMYRNDDTWYLVDYRTDPEFSFDQARVAFEGPYVNVAGMEYDVLSGGRVLLQRPMNTERIVTRLEVVSGFYGLLDSLWE